MAYYCTVSIIQPKMTVGINILDSVLYKQYWSWVATILIRVRVLQTIMIVRIGIFDSVYYKRYQCC